MKNKVGLFILVMSFFLFIPTAQASINYAMNQNCAQKRKCTIRTEANEKGNWLIPNVIQYLDPGDVVTLVDGSKVKSTNPSCSTDYYYVTISGKNGYVCGDNINFSTEGKYYDELRNAGFPESYLLSLNVLKEQHPSWIFTAYKTGIDWEVAIINESNVEYNSYDNKYWSRSYIQTTDPLYLSRQIGSYNASTNTYNQLEPGGWYAANKQTVAYYMDPRNFLNIYDIFMFENLGYNGNYQTKEVVSKVFNGTDLLQYVDYFIEAATHNKNSISPIFLGARSRQEVVKSDGRLSDSANGAGGVFNFYNLGAYSSCNNPVQCGLNYATNRGWTDPRKAIIGGATEIADGYINQKQNTLYFQRWNVTNNRFGNFSNQYMTNIAASKAESRSTQDAYSSINGLLNSSIEFTIPIYENMPVNTVNLPTTINDDEVVTDINQLIADVGYINKNGYIINVRINKLVNEMSNEMASKGITLTVANKNNNDKLSTGDVVTFKYGSKEIKMTIVIKGDANGDGAVSAIDYVKIKNYIMGTGTLNDAYKEAADVNNDNSVSAFDYINIKNYIMGNDSLLK